MKYTVSKLAKLSGVSSRTLRYYDEIALLKPERISESGYRIYESQQVNRLQQIMFYKGMGISLEDIKAILDDSNFNPKHALLEHKIRLLNKRKQIGLMLKNIDSTLAELEGEKTMTDQEKFEGLKETMIKENEEKYGAEVRKKFGDQLVDGVNEKVRNRDQVGHTHAEKLEIIIKEKLKEGLKKKDTKGPLGKEIYRLHKEWIMCYWPKYSIEGHKGLGDMYVCDERFKAYYDDEIEGMAQYLHDVIYANAN